MWRSSSSSFEKQRDKAKIERLEREVASLRAEMATVKETCKLLLRTFSPSLPAESQQLLQHLDSAGGTSGRQQNFAQRRTAPPVRAAPPSHQQPNVRQARTVTQRAPKNESPKAAPEGVVGAYNSSVMGDGQLISHFEQPSVLVVKGITGFKSLVMHDPKLAAQGGRFYYAVELRYDAQKGPRRKILGQFGWVASSFVARAKWSRGYGVGDYDDSWAVDFSRQEAFHAAKSKKYGLKAKRGDIVGCGIDTIQGTIEFFHNGNPLGLAYEVEFRHKNSSQKFFPGVTVQSAAVVAVYVDADNMPRGVPPGYKAVGKDLSDLVSEVGTEPGIVLHHSSSHYLLPPTPRPPDVRRDATYQASLSNKASSPSDVKQLVTENRAFSTLVLQNNINRRNEVAYSMYGRSLVPAGCSSYDYYGRDLMRVACEGTVLVEGQYYYEIFFASVDRSYFGWRVIPQQKATSPSQKVFLPGEPVMITDGGKDLTTPKISKGAQLFIGWRSSKDSYAVRVMNPSDPMHRVVEVPASRLRAVLLASHGDYRVTVKPEEDKLSFLLKFDTNDRRLYPGAGGEVVMLDNKTDFRKNGRELHGVTIGSLIDMENHHISWFFEGKLFGTAKIPPGRAWAPQFLTKNKPEVYFCFDRATWRFPPPPPLGARAGAQVKWLHDPHPVPSPEPFLAGNVMGMTDPIAEQKREEQRRKQREEEVEEEEKKKRSQSIHPKPSPPSSAGYGHAVGTKASRGEEEEGYEENDAFGYQEAEEVDAAAGAGGGEQATAAASSNSAYADIASSLNYDNPEEAEELVQNAYQELQKDGEAAAAAAPVENFYAGADNYIDLGEVYADVGEASTVDSAAAAAEATASDDPERKGGGVTEEERKDMEAKRRKQLEAQLRIREEGLKRGDWNSRFQAILETLPGSTVKGRGTVTVEEKGADEIGEEVDDDDPYGVPAQEDEGGSMATTAPARRGSVILSAEKGKESESAMVEISTLIAKFWEEAAPVARTIIEEYSVSPAEKTYKPFGAGGLAGGEKYKVGSLFMKFANDWQGIYKAHEFALKAANREMLGLRAYLDLRVKGLHFPLVILVDYLGHRLICSSLLPIDSSSLVYGSDDQGRTVHMSDGECNRIMEAAGKALNLKGHVVAGKTIFSCGDIEVHRGQDGRLYLLDTARVFPPEAPAPMISALLIPPGGGHRQARDITRENSRKWKILDVEKRTLKENIHSLLGAKAEDVVGIPCESFMAFCSRSATEVNVRASNTVSKLLRGTVCFVPRTESRHLFEMLRPELVKRSPKPLSSDAWSRFGLHNHQEHNLEVQKATSLLPQEAINAFIARCGRGEIVASQQELIHVLHSMGINCRFLGRVRSAINAEIQTIERGNKSVQLRERLKFIGQMLLTQMVARVHKAKIRRELRELGTSSKQAVIARIVKSLNTALGAKMALENLPMYMPRKKKALRPMSIGGDSNEGGGGEADGNGDPLDYRAEVFDDNTYNDMLKIRVQMKYGMRSSAFAREEMEPTFFLMDQIPRLGLLSALTLSLGVQVRLERMIELAKLDSEILMEKQRRYRRSGAFMERLQNPIKPQDIVAVEPIFRSLTTPNDRFQRVYGCHVGVYEAKLLVREARKFNPLEPLLHRMINRQQRLLAHFEGVHDRTVKLTGERSLEAAMSHIRVSRCYATLAYSLRKLKRKKNMQKGEGGAEEEDIDPSLWRDLATRAVQRVQMGFKACSSVHDSDDGDEKEREKEEEVVEEDEGGKQGGGRRVSYPLPVLVNAEVVLGLVSLTRGEINVAVAMLRNAYENLLVAFEDLPDDTDSRRKEKEQQIGGLCPAMIRVASLLAEALLIQQSDVRNPLLPGKEKEFIAERFSRSFRMFQIPVKSLLSPALVLGFEEAVLTSGIPAAFGFEAERGGSSLDRYSSNNPQATAFIRSIYKVRLEKTRLMATRGDLGPTKYQSSSWLKYTKGVTKNSQQQEAEEEEGEDSAKIAAWLRKLDMAHFVSSARGYATQGLLDSVHVDWKEDGEEKEGESKLPPSSPSFSKDSLPSFDIASPRELWFWGAESAAQRCYLVETWGEEALSERRPATGIISVSNGDFGTLAATEDGGVYMSGAMATQPVYVEEVKDHSDYKQMIYMNSRIHTLIRLSPMKMHRVMEVSVSKRHAAMRTLKGMVFTFGEGRHGQLGHGNLMSEASPRWVEGLRSFPAAQISCGVDFTLVRTAKGEVFGFGEQENSLALGTGTGKKIEFYPTRALYPQPIRDVSASKGYHVAVGRDGTLYWCGDITCFANSFTGKRAIPVSVMVPTRFVHCSAYEGHCAAVDVDGRLFTWGRIDAAAARCSISQYNSSELWAPPDNVSAYRGHWKKAKISQISTGLRTTMAIAKSDGMLFGCGGKLPLYRRFVKVTEGRWPVRAAPRPESPIIDFIVAYSGGRDTPICVFEERFTKHVELERGGQTRTTSWVRWMRHSMGWSPDPHKCYRVKQTHESTGPQVQIKEVSQYGSHRLVPLLPPSFCHQVVSTRCDSMLAILSPPSKPQQQQQQEQEDFLYAADEILDLKGAPPGVKITLIGDEVERPPDKDAKLFHPYIMRRETRRFKKGTTLKIRIEAPHYLEKDRDTILIAYWEDRSRSSPWSLYRAVPLPLAGKGKLVKECEVEVTLPNKPQPMVLFHSNCCHRAVDLMKKVLAWDSEYIGFGLAHLRYFAVCDDYAAKRKLEQAVEKRRLEKEAAKEKRQQEMQRRKEDRKRAREERKRITSVIHARIKAGEKPPPGGWASLMKTPQTAQKAVVSEKSKSDASSTVDDTQSKQGTAESETALSPAAAVDAVYMKGVAELSAKGLEIETEMDEIIMALADPGLDAPRLAELKTRSREIQTTSFQKMGAIFQNTMKSAADIYKKHLHGVDKDTRKTVIAAYSSGAKEAGAEYRDIVQKIQPKLQQMAMAAATKQI
eukprot:jgi/Bigna1/69664/fgenesh1_pg.9_\